jgi:hypothetical protein
MESGAVRLGDRDWVNMTELLAAINEGRRRDTTGMMLLTARLPRPRVQRERGCVRGSVNKTDATRAPSGIGPVGSAAGRRR